MIDPPVYPKAEELNQLDELLVLIIQFSRQKSYIQQKRFPFEHEATKRRELKRTNGEQYKFLKKEMNFLQKEIKRSMKRSEKIKQSKLIASAQIRGAKAFGEQLKLYVVIQKNQMKLKKVLKSHINNSERKQTLRNAKSSKQDLLQDTMKDHIYENLELNEHLEKVKNETKMFLQYKKTEPNNY